MILGILVSLLFSPWILSMLNTMDLYWALNSLDWPILSEVAALHQLLSEDRVGKTQNGRIEVHILEDNIYNIHSLCIYKCYVYILFSNKSTHAWFIQHSTWVVMLILHRKKSSTNISNQPTLQAGDPVLCDLFKPGRSKTHWRGHSYWQMFFVKGSNISLEKKQWERIFWSRWWFWKW